MFRCTRSDWDDRTLQGDGQPAATTGTWAHPAIESRLFAGRHPRRIDIGEHQSNRKRRTPMKLQQKLTFSVLLGVAVATLAACGGSDSNSNNAAIVGPFRSTVLVSDGSTAAPHTDANLQNGWGIVFNPTGVVWVSDN